jgi:SAM-dependent methyltransferase
MKCRHCRSDLGPAFLDLGFSPPSNAYLTKDKLQEPELYFPLKLRVCTGCWLVQTEDYARAEALFSPDYAYFSSVSHSWLQHAESYTSAMCARLLLHEHSFVIEVASNDGYLLKNFVKRKIPCLGIEPTDSTAKVAESIGVPVLREFFGSSLGERLAAEGRSADLLVGNNVYAHVPDINDFTLGMKAVLKPGGTITLEFPHVERLLAEAQFDTVYHEHFSYLSLVAVSRIFAWAGLRAFDVEQIPTHGGSLRVFGCHHDDARVTTSAVQEVLMKEQASGLLDASHYGALQLKADRIKDDLLAFLIEQKRAGKTVAAYGAAAKGNTLLNYAGVRSDLLSFVCDAAPSKQGKLLPGSHIPILPPSALQQRRPDWVVILPWNISQEVMSQQSQVRDWGAKFVIAVPRLQVFS